MRYLRKDHATAFSRFHIAGIASSGVPAPNAANPLGTGPAG